MGELLKSLHENRISLKGTAFRKYIEIQDRAL
ncbi:MAG: hypothetical protein QOJ51_576 [Acidobacteriaceae bacterium]|jgi:hypothetical protein|nr:hypothetical protein [Acidobacteriaceae bacterium]